MDKNVYTYKIYRKLLNYLNYMKKKFVSIVFVVVSMSVSSVFALDATTTVNVVPVLYTTTSVNTNSDITVPVLSMPSSVSSMTERAEVIGAKSLVRIQARGAQLIKERVNSLNQNAEAVAKSKGLSDGQKSAFALFFSGKIAELNTLGINISKGTEASSTKVLVQSIFTDFRVYGVVLPQVRLQKRIYEIQNHIAKLPEIFTKVQTNIDAQKAKGKDVTVWQKNLDDAKILVATDTDKLSALMSQINSLKVADYGTTSKATIKSVNDGIQNIARDINSIGKKVRNPVLKNKR